MCKPKGEAGMDFKDLQAFNLALLVKQSCQILTCTSSLLHQLYQAKYFLHSTFAMARLGTSPSYTWHGFFEA